MKILWLLFFFVCMNGCTLRERERALDQRSAQLDQKEQELLLKERSLQLKEEELKKRDSLSIQNKDDSTGVYDPQLTGSWAVKMLCTEATCPGSAVGDIKNETWQISYQDRNILVRAMAGNQLVRVYSGLFNGTILELEEDHQKMPASVPIRISVRLTKSDSLSMEGQREILRENNCRIVYSVNLVKQ